MAKKQHSSAGIVLSHEALIHARRVKHDMSQEQLAIAARIDVKTIRRAEDEKPIDPSFAHIIASALGVELSSLVKRDPASSDPIVDAIAKLLVAIAFKGDYPPPYKADAVRLLTELVLFLGLKDSFDAKKLLASGGSLIVTVPLSRRDTITLTDAFLKGKLRRFGVTSIRVVDETANKSGRDQARHDKTADRLAAELMKRDSVAKDRGLAFSGKAQDAWKDFVDIYGSAVRRWMRIAQLRDIEAEALVEKVFLTVAKSLPKVAKTRTTRSFRSWLKKITQKAVIDFQLAKADSAPNRKVPITLTRFGGVKKSASPPAVQKPKADKHGISPHTKG